MRREPNLCLIPETDISQMSAPTPDIDNGYYENYTGLAANLLTHYSFDLGGYKVSELITRWQAQFPVNWLHLAVVEALYQGRYKAISVQQILTMWLRRGQASFHFNMEFERLICSKFPENLTTNMLSLALPPVATSSHLVQNSNIQSSNIQNSNTQNSTVESASYLVQDKNNTSTITTNHSITQKNQYKETQENSIKTYAKPEWTTVRRPPIPNIEVVKHEPQSRVTTQLTKMLPSVTHHSAIEQFTPEKTAVSESFTSKLKSIVNNE
ncbi:MAG: hypothetical protein IGS39_11655 [Calothrix sp. C42_A2020_038]|nr:hypothetical protein [Calothrix sp. C42_A2020_038]